MGITQLKRKLRGLKKVEKRITFRTPIWLWPVLP